MTRQFILTAVDIETDGLIHCDTRCRHMIERVTDRCVACILFCDSPEEPSILVYDPIGRFVRHTQCLSYSQKEVK